MSELFKVLIKAPVDKLEASAVYPLVYKVREDFPDSQIHILTKEGHESLYKAFGFEVFIYAFDESKENLPNIHKYAVNQNEIFNIDLFIDLVGTMKSSFMGFSFRAKARVGYVKGLSKLFYTHKVEPLNTYRPDRKFLYLYENYKEEKYLDFKLDGAETLESLKTKDMEEMAKLPSYFLIHSKGLLENLEMWNDFFRFFENQYFVVWFDPSLGEERYEEHSVYLKSLEQKNVYLLKTGTDENFIRTLAHSIGYLTDYLEWSYISSFLTIPTYSFVKKATDIPFMEHHKNIPNLIEINGGIPSKWIGPEESRPIETVDSFVNLLHDLHKL